MSDFWAKRLGVPAPGAPAALPQPVSTQPWWAPRQVVQAPQQVVQVQPNGMVMLPGVDQQHFGELIQQNSYTTTKAQSASDDSRCPDCDSGNYMSPKGHPNAFKQCFDCGYNPRFLHTTHGISATGENIPTFTARGQTLAVNNFNPKQIIGRVTI